MRTHDAREQKPERVSLADEEGVKQVLVNFILGLWDVVHVRTSDLLYAPAPVGARLRRFHCRPRRQRT
jgi:hypothetical protein